MGMFAKPTWRCWFWHRTFWKRMWLGDARHNVCTKCNREWIDQ